MNSLTLFKSVLSADKKVRLFLIHVVLLYSIHQMTFFGDLEVIVVIVKMVTFGYFGPLIKLLRVGNLN